VKIPANLKIAGLVVATTSLYMYVGSMVPQKEVYPPKEIILAADLSPADMAKTGREIMDGKGLCFTCHTIGKKEGPFRFPDLDGVDARAKTRKPGYSDVDYLAESIYEPNTFIVPGFNPGMPVINKPPIGLTDQEILCVIAYLQTLGGQTTVTMKTTLKYMPGHESTVAAAPAAPAAPAPPAAAPPGAKTP
jgi:mono/diheme cytochrome c family protein